MCRGTRGIPMDGLAPQEAPGRPSELGTTSFKGIVSRGTRFFREEMLGAHSSAGP